MPTFVLNDENVVNSYGFRVRNAGINFVRFDANPVMLDSHLNQTDKVMGSWKNRRIEGALLKMDTQFDSEYPEAKRLEGQVDRGYVKGASPGLGISFDTDCFERQPDGNWDLILSEMMEGSVCGVPSNSGALLQLYDKATGEPIPEDQIKLSLQNLSAKKLNLNTPNMEKIILTPGAMSALLAAGVPTPDNATEISRGVEKLQTDLSAQTSKVIELQGKLDAQAKLQAETLVDTAIGEERILAGDRAEYVSLALANFGLAAKMIAKIPGKVSLNGQVNNSNEKPGTVKTMDDFEKLDLQAQLKFKAENPASYKLLFSK